MLDTDKERLKEIDGIMTPRTPERERTISAIDKTLSSVKAMVSALEDKTIETSQKVAHLVSP